MAMPRGVRRDRALTGHPVSAPVRTSSNPLYADSELFYEYIGLLDDVLDQPENRDAGDLRLSSVLLCAAGLLAIMVGSIAGHWWQPIAFLWKPGRAALAVGVLAFGAALIRLTEAGIRLLGGEIAGQGAASSTGCAGPFSTRCVPSTSSRSSAR